MTDILNLKSQLLIVPTYAGILALLYLALTIRTVVNRGKTKISIGSSGDRNLERCIRAHGNFSEYVPIILILMTFLELRGASNILLHVCGGVMILARISHAFGISQEPENFAFRIAGMVPTITILAVTAIANIYFTLAN